MVTILRPRIHKRDDDHIDISSENLPGNADEKVPQAPGVELTPDEGEDGTGSAPGEGPNPTA